MKALRNLFFLVLSAAVVAGHSTATTAAPTAPWVETFATVGAAQVPAGGMLSLDYGVQNNSFQDQDIVFAAIIRFSDGSRMILNPRENMYLAPGDANIRFGMAILPPNAPAGPAEFFVAAYVRGHLADLQGPRLVLDKDSFEVLP